MKPLLLAVLWLLTAQTHAPQRFKTTAEAVRVDVLVKEGSRPVAGLSATDFELRDSGVVQRIDAVAFEDVPLNVMVALDTSDSLAGRPLEHLRSAALAAIGLMRPDDRVALLTFNHRLWLRIPWTADRSSLQSALRDVQAGGATGLHDVAYAALTLKGETPGRAMVLLFSDGNDTSSWLSGQHVMDTGRRTDAVVYAVAMSTGPRAVPGYRLDFRSGVQPPVPTVAASLLTEEFLPALASQTGGEFFAVKGSESLRETFVGIITEFRTRYLLTYTPTGVEATGWHPIDVRLKTRRAAVTARRGYLK